MHLANVVGPQRMTLRRRGQHPPLYTNRHTDVVPRMCLRGRYVNSRYSAAYFLSCVASRAVVQQSALSLNTGAKIPAVFSQLDGDDDGVLDREAWSKWWVQRWSANQRSRKLLGGDDGDRETSTGQLGDNSDGGSGAGGDGGAGGGERISRLAERARQARRRAGTDIHTAAWRGDLALVKVCLVPPPRLLRTGTLRCPRRPKPRPLISPSVYGAPHGTSVPRTAISRPRDTRINPPISALVPRIRPCTENPPLMNSNWNTLRLEPPTRPPPPPSNLTYTA